MDHTPGRCSQDTPLEPLRSELADDPNFADLVEEFIGELPGRTSAMRQTLDRRDSEALRRLAHRLKGAAGSYGFPAITDAARDLEQAAHDADAEACETAWAKLDLLCRRALAGKQPPATM